MNKEIHKQVFVPDSGSLLDIRLFDITLEDWQSLFHYLSSRYKINYSGNGISRPLPNPGAVWQISRERAVLVEISLLGFTVNCHFFDEEEIEMDLRPEEVFRGKSRRGI